MLKAFGGGPFVTDRFGVTARRSRDAELEKIQLDGKFNAFLAGYPIAVLTLVVGGGGLAVAQDAMTIGAFVAFTTFYFRMLVPVNWMGYILSFHQETASALTRLFEVLDTSSDIADPVSPVSLPSDIALDIRFEGVRFSYPDTTAHVLDGVNLHIRRGETVALVGATGSGKTTLGALVSRLADPTDGRVLVGGVDVRDLALEELRSTIGMAFEDAMLFSVSVRENLTLAREGIGEDDIAKALAVTQSNFVYALPNGLDTVVGEQGLSLSGGQRQRLALARALLGRPRVLVLDDPMSALDVRTEEALERELRRAFQGVTTLIVARRPSTALLADRVAVLNEGRIVDIGTHDELLTRSSAYRHVLIASKDADAPGSAEEAASA